MVLRYVKHSTLGFIIWANVSSDSHSIFEQLILKDVPGIIVSAGLASVHDGIVECWGESENIRSSTCNTDAHDLSIQLGLKVLI